MTKECVTRAQGSEARQQKLQAVAGARLTDDKDAVDPRDALLQALYRLLSADAKVAPSYLSREQLLETAQQLHRSVEQSQSVRDSIGKKLRSLSNYSSCLGALSHRK